MVLPEIVLNRISILALFGLLFCSAGYLLKPHFELVKLRMIRISGESTIVD
ncbi:hypothetical protein [Macrococcus carouselicus]|uniref:hypothetical protein n=1 Tax=Macrococcus carouselicus TaxID=69969 RepID=UPI00140AC988|nr:hypothetical protein [Macrococcus carouselicus]